MSKVIDKSKTQRLDNLIERYTFLHDTINDYSLMKNQLENEIIHLLESTNTNMRGRVRLTTQKALKSYSIREIRKLFNNDDESDLLNSMIVNIDIEKSTDAIKYEVNLPEPLVKAYELKLNNLSKLDTPKLTIERKIDDE